MPNHIREGQGTLSVEIPALPNDPFEVKTVDLKEYDVCCGQIGNSQFLNHIGNRRFRKVLDENALSFRNATSLRESDEVVMQVCREVTEKGGRFLEGKFKRGNNGSEKVWTNLGGTIYTSIEDNTEFQRVRKPKPLTMIQTRLRDAITKPRKNDGRKPSCCPCPLCQEPSQSSVRSDAVARYERSIHSHGRSYTPLPAIGTDLEDEAYDPYTIQLLKSIASNVEEMQTDEANL